jgi:hypothetical protein
MRHGGRQRGYRQTFDALTERQRNILGRLAVDDAGALADTTTVAELTELGLVWETLDETANVSTLFMPQPVQRAWRVWSEDHITPDDLANADADASAFLARAEAAPPPLDVYDSKGGHTDREAAIGEADPPPPRRRGRGRGRPRNRRKAPQ